MGVGVGLYMYDVVVKRFTFAISSPDEFLFYMCGRLKRENLIIHNLKTRELVDPGLNFQNVELALDLVKFH